MAKMKKRSDGLYYQDFIYNGKRYYVYGHTKAELEEKARLKKNQLVEGKTRHDNPSLDEFHEMWTESRRGTVKEATLRCQHFQYESCSNVVIQSLNKRLGDIKLKEISPEDIRTVQRALIEDNGNSEQTVNDKIAVLNHVFNDALKERWIDYNPCIAVKNLQRSVPPARDTFHRALSREETERFFKEAENSAYYDIFRLAVNTGMRVGEIGALFESDISDGMIHVRRTLTKSEVGNMVIGDTTKTMKGTRDIPLNDAIIGILEHQRQINRMLYGNKVISFNDTIFKAPEGGLIVVAPTNREIKRICKRAHIEPFTMHAFRATFATRCIESGVEPKTLQELLGHTSIKMSLDLYAHVMDSTKKNAMRQLKII
ncbi:tyrosine-type recombinase/integrase [Butyrivibrio sp. AC2005]|uniref:tyrosine-type recombinase/integrase n=1 Tax=Butyrivibrio sp. AC2005 TaxID=1280672 RepID=UPI00040FFA27|nr:site-specific integrase [Butyrivibrio sp. AC2005]